MAEDDATSGSKPSWHQREVAQALQRLANARAQLASLEEQVADAVPAVPVDPAEVARAAELQADIDKYTAKASGRFGGSSARTKLDEAQRQLRLLLHRVGVERVEDLHELGARPAPAVDATVLDFARRECADAEQAFLEVAAMVIPEVDPDAEEPEVEAEVIVAAGSFADDDADLDLRIEPSAAS